MCPTGIPQTFKLLVSLPFPQSAQLFNPSWNEGERILPAMYLAEDQINSRTDLLPCHQLELMVVDGGCDIASTTAVGTATGLLDKDKGPVIGMVGPGCSASTLQTGYIINQQDIDLVHIHGGASKFLANRSKFNNSLGILGSTQSFSELAAWLVKGNEWHHIAILFESGRAYYTTIKDDFVRALNNDEYNVTVLFESTVYSTFYPLDGVRDSLSRIVVLSTALYHTQRVLCLAYHNKMFFPAYQWIIISHRLHEIETTSNISLTYRGRTYTCSPAMLVNNTLEAAFFVYHQLSLKDSDSDKPKFANTSFNDFLDHYKERADERNVSTSVWAYYFYDAVWAWARVLHQLTTNYSGIFNDFRYGNKSFTNLILESFYANDFRFEGMSGSISFNSSNGFFDRPVNLYQIIKGKEIHTAHHNGSSILNLQTEGMSRVVISDIVQADTSLNSILIAFFALLLFMWFFVLVTLHVLTVVYRNSKSVKASSPKLNHFAFIGTYLSVFGLLLFLFLQVEEHLSFAYGPICHAAWVWILPIGLTLSIGTVILRTWRLYRIFLHYLNPGKFISNTALVMILAILISVDIIFALIWTAVDPRRLDETKDTIQNGSAAELVIIRVCRSQNDRLWLILLLTYKALLLLVMIVLTVLTRQIPNKTFTTATLQVFSYTFSVVFGTGFALYYFFLYFASTRFRLDANVNNTVLYVIANILLCLLVSFVFVPPLVPVAREKSCTIKLLQQLSKLRRKRQRKLSHESADDCGSEEVRIRKTSADALLH